MLTVLHSPTHSVAASLSSIDSGYDMTDRLLAEPVPPAPANVRWLKSTEALDQWLQGLAPGTPIALDTEFERVSTFFPIPGLVQLGAAGDFWLVDPHVAES